MKTSFATILLLAVLPSIFYSCSEKAKVKSKDDKEPKSIVNRTCDDFFEEYNPDDSTKIRFLQECLENSELSTENKKLINGLIDEINHTYSFDDMPLTIEHPLFPIHKLKENQIGILGYSITREVNGQWEDFSKEDQLLKKDFGYQSIDSMGKLVSFQKVFNSIYPLTKPTIYWYSTKRSNKSTVTDLLYMGNECLSFFHYNFTLNKKDKAENIVFGSPYALEIEFVHKPDLDRKFKEQSMKSCIDCPTNYQDQTIFAQLKGTNLYFAQADSWPINDQLDAPIRSLVLLTNDGRLISLWSSELDLFGCGCL